jgi:pyrroline-5-carboxylate reductase
MKGFLFFDNMFLNVTRRTDMTTPVIAMIGAGNMGSSLILGLINSGHSSDKIWASDTDEKKLADLSKRFNIHTTTDNIKAVESSDIVIFAVKPQIFSSAAKSLMTTIRGRRPLIISIAAGIRVANIEKWLGGQAAIVRAMPNMPALIGCGATGLYANREVSDTQRNQAESILRAVGVIVWLSKEELLDTVTTLSGNGPAYFFLVMEILQQAAEQLGLEKETARLLTLQTALGAARLAIESGKPLEELRRNVTSPGGTTEKALSVLQDNNIKEVFKQALEAGKIRSEELAEMMGQD